MFPMNWTYFLLITSLIVISAVGLTFTGLLTADTEIDEGKLAKCLSQKGAVMYGSRGCPHCQQQKALFGDTFQHITYVECTEEREKCLEEGITAVPAWKINGELHTGVKTLEELAQMSGCPF